MKTLEYEVGPDGYIPLPEKKTPLIPSGKVGRPKKYDKRMTQRLLYTLPLDVAAKVRKLAYDHCMTTSDYVRQALEVFSSGIYERQKRHSVKTEQNSVLVPEELFDTVSKAAAKIGVKNSTYVRQAILYWMEAGGKE